MSDLLKLALTAQLPLVRVECDDLADLENLLKHLSDRTVSGLGAMSLQPNRWKPKHVYYGMGEAPPKDVDYADLLDREITLVVVNPLESQWEHALDCGRLTPPIEYIKTQLGTWLDAQQVEKFGRYFAGMSLTDAIETIMLTQARDGALSSIGINETKSYLGAGLPGLESLDTVQSGYIAPEWAETWLKVDAPLLENPKYRELWPKGFMLHGPTGTGKTELARFIAKALQWPLYRLDMGTLYSRWQGASEQNLRNVLSFMASQGEAVFLLDEAEKLFGNEAVGQASLTTLLSMLLWWLQGETNRTVTVMTANSLSVIPPELYRPGRLDAVHEMVGLKEEAARAFVKQIANSTAKRFKLDPDALRSKVKLSGFPASQASLVALVRSAAKQMIVQGEKE